MEKNDKFLIVVQFPIEITHFAFLRVSPKVLKRPEKPYMGVFYHKITLKVDKNWKTGKPAFWKLSVFLSDMKTDIIFGILGIENPRKHYSANFLAIFELPVH